MTKHETQFRSTAESRGAMTASRIGKLRSALPVEVSWFDGVIRLRDQDLFGEQLGNPCAVFLRRVFGLSEVISVEISRDQFTADICYDPGPSTLTDLLRRLAAAIRDPSPPDLPALPADSLPHQLYQSAGRIKIWRFGTTLTTWHVVHHLPGRMRLCHPMIRGNATVACRIRDIVEGLSGVLGSRASPRTGSLVIRFDSSLTTASRLLQTLDRVPELLASSDLEPSSPSRVGFALSNTSLVLAVAGDTIAPIVSPVYAALLVGSNFHTFQEAGRQLGRGQLGLPIVYTSIVVAAFTTGHLTASAAMGWMITFWRHLHNTQVINARRRLLGQFIQQPHFVRLETPNADDVGAEIRIEDLKPKDVIRVAAGEQIPVDGWVVRGQGLVDERMVRGADGLDRKRPDERVFAGSILRFGELRIEVREQSSQTQAAELARAAVAAITQPSGSRLTRLRAKKFADRTAAPTMAAAGLGLLVGDLGTAAAILQPDYATGLGIALPLETLQALASCMRRGIAIREPEAIERLASADLLILDDGFSLEHPELEVDTVQAFPGYIENDVLRYAAAAFHELDDERAFALRQSCQNRGIAPLDIRPVEFATDVTLLVGPDCIKVGELGARAHGTAGQRDTGDPRCSERNSIDSLMVGINGRVAGLIHFRHSARLAAVSALKRLRSKQNIQIGIVSDRSPSDLPGLKLALGAEFYVDAHSPDDRIDLLRYGRQRGLKIAYAGDCRINARTAAEAYVAISFARHGIGDLDNDPAPIYLLQPRLSKLNQLWDIASIHHRRLKVAQGYAMIPNLLCVAGAFMWGFTSLASVVLTNLGTYSVYRRTVASMQDLERQISHFQPPCAQRQ